MVQLHIRVGPPVTTTTTHRTTTTIVTTTIKQLMSCYTIEINLVLFTVICLVAILIVLTE